MKQEITKKQWDELSEEQKDSFCKTAKVKSEKVCSYRSEDFFITIGQLIKFLGDNWWKKIGREVGIVISEIATPNNDELCDWLWEAVKYKLKKQNENRN